MANRVRGEQRVELGGLELVLDPTFSRLANLEEALGRSVVQIVQELGANQRLTLGELATAYRILAREPEKLSRERIGGAILNAGIAIAVAHVASVLSAALVGNVDDDEETDGDDAGKDAGDGSNAE